MLVLRLQVLVLLSLLLLLLLRGAGPCMGAPLGSQHALHCRPGCLYGLRTQHSACAEGACGADCGARMRILRPPVSPSLASVSALSTLMMGKRGWLSLLCGKHPGHAWQLDHGQSEYIETLCGCMHKQTGNATMKALGANRQDLLCAACLTASSGCI